MKTIKSSSILDAAELYISKNWAVMPCLPRKKEPHFGLIKRSHLDATVDLDLVNFWIKMDPKMNLGISAIASNLVIIDIDFRNGGYIKDEWMNTYTVKTGDGYHLYFHHQEGIEYRGQIGDGFDVKFKGYVVAAPSLHPSGARYEANNLEVQPLPEFFASKIVKEQW